MKIANNVTRSASACLFGLIAALGACESTGPRGSGYDTAEAEERQPAPPDPAAAQLQDHGAADGQREPRMGGGMQAGMNVVSMPFPTGDRATSPLLLEQIMPPEVRLGNPFDYEYRVTNTTGGVLQNVALLLESQSNLEVISATPSAQMTDAGTLWPLGELAAGETRVVEVRARASEAGRASNCISVSYNNLLCASVPVVDPDLTLAKRATQRALRCDMVELSYEVSNTGTGTAVGVVVRDQLPSGMTVNGSRSISRQVGDLAAGESERFTVMADVSRTGDFSSMASAEADGGLSAESGEPTTTIVEPELEITSDCRDSQFINRDSTYTFEVANTGDGVSENTIVTASFPAAAELRGMSEGGVDQPGRVQWMLGTMQPGETATVSVDLRSSVATNLTVEAEINGDCADPATAECTVEYEGIPAILVEVIDIADPVEVGQQTTYVITVTNQGTAPDRDIQIKATLPPTQEYVSDSGRTDGEISGREITFRPLASLAPGQEAEWRLITRATGEADSRLSVEVSSERFEEPIRETESTNLYR